MTDSRQKRLGNFRDPFGLLGRMLKSGNRAAYAALFREGLRLAARPVDAMLGASRPGVIHERDVEHPLVFIVGAPRSGTTLVYQALSAYLDVTFPSNLTELFPRSPLTAAKLQKSLWSRARPDFKNFYGQTSQFSGPNDAFHIWNRWLGEDRYQPQQAISDNTIAEMQRFFAEWTNTFGKPFLNKNNRNAFAIEMLAQHLPSARFVVVRRNPLYVAQSLIIARQQIQGTKSIGWGLKSSSTVATPDSLAYVDDVCRQVTGIDAEIERQLKTVESDRVLHVTYESFCENPQHWVSRVTTAFPGVELNPHLPLESLRTFEVSQKLTISNEEQQRMRKCLLNLMPSSACGTA